MFGSLILDVALGIVLTFLLFSLILTSAQEGIESLLKGRAKDLERAIGELLDKGANATIVQKFYEHPLIYPLFPGSYKAGGDNLPSYIPSANFAAAVADIAQRAARGAPGANAPAAAAAPTQRIVDAYNVANQYAAGVPAQMLKGLEAWYDSAMERLSGKYKRKTQMWLFGLGLVIAAIGNINPITIAEQISKDQKLREHVVALASSVQKQTADANRVAPPNPQVTDDKKGADATADKGAANTAVTGQALAANAATVDKGIKKSLSQTVEAEVQKQLQEGLPVGWKEYGSIVEALSKSNQALPPFDWLKGLIGWLIAALAGMLGAPFWFDQLNRIMNLRAALKPDTKKQ